MREEDCKLETLVAFNGKKYPLKRGKIVGQPSKGKVLIEWGDGQRHLIAISSLLSKSEADAKEIPLKEKFDKQKEKKAALDKKKAEAAKLATQLEDEFTKVFNEVNPEIQARIEAADKLIGEAEELSEKYGLPFRGTSPFNMSFIPATFKKKWAKLLDQEYGYDFVSDLTGAYGGEYDGWQSSQVC